VPVFQEPKLRLQAAGAHAFLQRVLDSEHLLGEIVREADVEWGRLHGERPHFEKAGRQPLP
jgi:hypothetical protein